MHPVQTGERGRRLEENGEWKKEGRRPPLTAAREGRGQGNTTLRLKEQIKNELGVAKQGREAEGGTQGQNCHPPARAARPTSTRGLG